MVGSQDAIPLERGWRFHDCTPLDSFFRLPAGFDRGLKGLKAKAPRTVGGAGRAQKRWYDGLSIHVVSFPTALAFPSED
jgi:hypothetical protein